MSTPSSSGGGRPAAGPPAAGSARQPVFLPLASSPRPARPRATARSMYRLHRLLEPNPGYRWLAARLESMPRLRRLFTATEKSVKTRIFGCQMCAQCTLPVTGYACPMTCPKQLRNGPCGGVGADGSCEVYPAMQCVWVTGFERASGQGRSADLQLLQRPVDHRLWDQSSWIRYWQGQDEELWTRA